MAKADNTKISPPSTKSDPASDNQEVSTQSEQLSTITFKPVNFGAVVDSKLGVWSYVLASLDLVPGSSVRRQ